MPPIESFPYHRQDNETMCGPACAQMVLSHLKTQELPWQSTLRKNGDQLTPPPTLEIWKRYVDDVWATRPDELKQALLSHQPPPNAIFEAYYNGSIKDFSVTDDAGNKITGIGYLSRLKKWIKEPKSPTYPIVPVHGPFYYKQQRNKPIDAHGYSNLAKYDVKSNYDAHWVVLFKHDFEGFLGNDPYFPLTKGANEEKHKEGDNCKPVLIHISGTETQIGDYIFPAINRTAVSWTDVPVNHPGGRIAWRPPTGESPIQPPPLPPPPLPMVPFDMPDKKFDEKEIKIEWIRQQMERFGLFANRPCSTYLSGTTFGMPRLVRRLDVIGRNYYLIPMLKPDGNSSAMIRVDAPTGQYLDSLYYSENPFIFDKSQLRQTWFQSISQQLTQFDSKLGKAFSTQISEPATEMVWLPCRESISAFFPFYVIKPEPNRRVPVRVDWKLFPFGLTY